MYDIKNKKHLPESQNTPKIDIFSQKIDKQLLGWLY